MKKAGVVSIIGRPNAGKSTLLNRILGMKLSIVSPKAQTTRDRVLAIYDEPEFGQMVIVDTPGVHAAKEGGVNEFMMKEVEKSLDEPDLVWYLVDPKSEFKREETVIKAFSEFLKPGTPVFLIITKSDLKVSLKNRTEKAESLRALYPFTKTFFVSADKNRGIDELVTLSWEAMPEGERLFPEDEAVSDKPVRFFVSEFIREQLFFRLGEELPYACAIRMDHFKEDVKPIKIQATILVERESQKGIVIGAGAAKIKEISMNARKSIETFLGAPVVLVLKVDVLKDWSRDAKALEKLGYQLPKKSKKTQTRALREKP
jgi:GTPase